MFSVLQVSLSISLPDLTQFVQRKVLYGVPVPGLQL
ncbi:hypothetical protein PM8797T_01344 [Gimesia maris DSM 8797]|jgi:hypothetical protein|uniref:Uncharacterized protein n=1 Tax=Gimesia maris TaxID=122 RepID=A0ABX5YKR5_9PLAN|nr:hypothetical protein PM8797T_01344 [Gimesia maris DSM 8797]QDT78771.1 hypothetical protein Mal35_22210 [Gimesia maris]QEG16283.1 hypothetical protein GmarT_21450 [Gimesia maris]